MAIVLNGSSQWVTVTDNDALDIPADASCTLTGWIYRDTGSSGDVLYIYSHKLPPAASINVIWLDNGDSYKLQVLLFDGAGHVLALTSTNGLGLETWYHFAIVISGGTLTLYTDGSANGSGSVASFNTVSPAGDCEIGKRSTTGYYLDGMAAEFAKWDTAHNIATIQALAGGAPPINYPTDLIWNIPFYDDDDEDIIPLTTTPHGSPTFDTDNHPVSYGSYGPFPHFLRRVMTGGMIGMGT